MIFLLQVDFTVCTWNPGYNIYLKTKNTDPSVSVKILKMKRELLNFKKCSVFTRSLEKCYICRTLTSRSAQSATMETLMR